MSTIPSTGDVVTVKIAKGCKVRNPRSGLPHQDGDRVTWNPYYRRRHTEGAFSEVRPAKPAASAPKREKEATS